MITAFNAKAGQFTLTKLTGSCYSKANCPNAATDKEDADKVKSKDTKEECDAELEYKFNSANAEKANKGDFEVKASILEECTTVTEGGKAHSNHKWLVSLALKKNNGKITTVGRRNGPGIVCLGGNHKKQVYETFPLAKGLKITDTDKLIFKFNGESWAGCQRTKPEEKSDLETIGTASVVLKYVQY